MTKTQRLAVILTGVNLVLLTALSILFALSAPDLPIAHRAFALAEGDAAVLRGRALELVDAAGRVRAEFRVEPDGEAVFRMRDPGGTIRVKLGAGRGGSGLVLLDETTEPGVQILARRSGAPSGATTTSITLTGAEGRRRVLEP